MGVGSGSPHGEGALIAEHPFIPQDIPNPLCPSSAVLSEQLITVHVSVQCSHVGQNESVLQTPLLMVGDANGLEFSLSFLLVAKPLLSGICSRSRIDGDREMLFRRKLQLDWKTWGKMETPSHSFWGKR